MGLGLGQQWSVLAESIGVGATHLSNRGLRPPMNKYPFEFSVFAVALFLDIVACVTRLSAQLRLLEGMRAGNP